MRVTLGHSVAGVAAAVLFACVAYAYLTLPDVRPSGDRQPVCRPHSRNLRAREARAAGKSPKHVQRWIAYRRISPTLTRAVLVAEDAAFWQHEGVDYDELQKSIELDWARGQFTARRQHHHAAAREEPLPVAVKKSRCASSAS